MMVILLIPCTCMHMSVCTQYCCKCYNINSNNNNNNNVITCWLGSNTTISETRLFEQRSGCHSVAGSINLLHTACGGSCGCSKTSDWCNWPFLDREQCSFNSIQSCQLFAMWRMYIPLGVGSHQPSMSCKDKQLAVEPRARRCCFVHFCFVILMKEKEKTFSSPTAYFFLSSFHKLAKANFCATVTVRSSSRCWLAWNLFVSSPASTPSLCFVWNRTSRLSWFFFCCFFVTSSSKFNREAE